MWETSVNWSIVVTFDTGHTWSTVRRGHEALNLMDEIVKSVWGGNAKGVTHYRFRNNN